VARPTAGERLRGGALGAVLAATLTAGAFDAVLLLAAPSFLAWTAAGALAGDGGTRPRGRLRLTGRLIAAALPAALVAAAGLGAAHAAAMGLYGAARPGPLAAAARLAPGDYRVQLRAAQAALQGGRCDPARARAAAARRLAPAAPAPARIVAACGAVRPGAGARPSRVSAPRGRR
jgi:hypothetical protein